MIEALLGFYKMLLYNKKGHKYARNVVEQVISLNDEKYKNIRNTILLILYYAEYERVFLKLENEEMSRKSNEKRSFLDITGKHKKNGMHQCLGKARYGAERNHDNAGHQLEPN